MVEPRHAVSQPSLDTFKLAMVNRECQKEVLEYYKITAKQLGAKSRINHYQTLIFNVFDNTNPELTKYRGNIKNKKSIR